MAPHQIQQKKDDNSVQEIGEMIDERSNMKSKQMAAQQSGQKHSMMQGKVLKIKQENQKVHKDHHTVSKVHDANSRYESHHKQHSHRPIEYEDNDSHRGSEMHHQ